MMRAALAALWILLLAGPSSAGFEEGVAAYERGDYAAALREFMPLAEGGHPLAQAYLGDMYLYGQGVRRDDGEAAKWYREAAERGHLPAQFNLGLMYATARGVRGDFVEAYMWFSLAATRGQGEMRYEALQRRDYLLLVMTPEQVADAQRRAREWKPKE